MNSNEPNMSPSQLEALLKVASQRLGTTSEALKQAAQNGDFSHMVGNMNQSESAAMQKVLTDPEAAKKLLSSPQAQKLFQMLQKKDGGAK